ncbi:MAG TPA: cytochrome bc complex cytochrome b subunit [Steroidobacteraceae bacterium]|nr:cytochrome bc complex cytochrome b subunit [Steroidobacteraceae bacterium]
MSVVAKPPGAPAVKTGRLRAWFYKRLPIEEFISEQLTGYYAPKNFNFWYFFGVLALFVLVLQLVTGIFLTMFYKVGAATSFDSVAYIMREVDYGWLIRYLHSTGASAFFVVIYLHMFRGLLYGSYRTPRELLWVIGMLVYFALMAEAFLGYVLPWGNMSYWAAQVIVNVFGTIPAIGPGLVEWIRGDYGIADATLNRFFALHVVAVPLALLLLVVLHLVALRRTGSNNPDGIEIKEKLGPDGKPLDGVPFHPYYTVKDTFGLGAFLVIFALVVFFAPTFGGYFLEHANFEPMNALSTPPEITPSWYLTPYYAILRGIPNQRLGALVLLLALVAYLFLPWLDRSPVKSMRYKGWVSRTFFAFFILGFLGLVYVGLHPVAPVYVLMGRICTVFYFAYFVLMPWYTRIDPVKPVPERLRFRAHA